MINTMHFKNSKVVKIVVILLIAIVVWIGASLTVYLYDVPEGYSKKHFSYEDALEYARSIDPDAVVEENCTETECSHTTQRVWNAKINGHDVHVASYPASIMGKAIWETPVSMMLEAYKSKDYYYLTTDEYIYTIIPIFDNYAELGEVSINKDEFSSITSSREFDAITKDELSELWDEYTKVTEDLKKNSHQIKYTFYFTTGGKEYCFSDVSEYEYDKIYRDIFYP